MELRKAAARDVEAMAALYDGARTALKAAGVDQWQDGYPDASAAAQDVAAGTAYVLEEAGLVVGTACLAFGEEPTYRAIERGAWQGRGEYGYLHRVAVSNQIKGRGAAGLFFQELKRQAERRGVSVLRGDTHRDNRPMRRAMEKNGFSYRGIIHLEDGAERLAFEWLALSGS